eukprot:1615379-Amphidinium_carterae.1
MQSTAPQSAVVPRKPWLSEETIKLMFCANKYRRVIEHLHSPHGTLHTFNHHHAPKHQITHIGSDLSRTAA